MKRGFTLAALLLCCGGFTPAQINLPPVIPPLPSTQLPDAVATAGATVPQALSSVRTRANSLLGRYPQQVERDPRGAPAVRSVIVALGPAPDAIARALESGFQVLADETLQPWNERLVTLLAPRGMSTRRALRLLRDRDASGSYDFDHLYVENAAPASVPPAAAEAAAAPVVPPSADLRAVPLGMIDGGIDPQHPAFALRPPLQLGCAGRQFADAHGTAVASLLVGSDAPAFQGAAPGATLIAVDIYCEREGPGGRARDIAAGLALLATRGVRVINLSVIGPENQVLGRAVKRAQEGGILLVAAAGNDGPNAGPLYPAAYPGVIAVTAVDARNRILLEACRGEHVAFAAPGADMIAALPGGGYVEVRGTSFAAPLVAGLLARELAGVGDATNAAALRALEMRSLDAGRRGRDRNYGAGIVATDLRPAAGVAARPAARPSDDK